MDNKEDLTLDQSQTKKFKVKLSPFFIVNGIILFLGIAFILKENNTPCSDWGCLGKGIGIALAIIALFVITYIIWLIYCIILSVRKKKAVEKFWFIPLLIVIAIPTIPALVFVIIPNVIYKISDYSEHREFHNIANVRPQIIPAETASSIPKLDGYKTIGKEISAKELLENNGSHIGEKVLLKGFPEENTIITYSETGEKKDSERTTMIKDPDGNIFSISFIDTESEFADSEWRISSGSYNYAYHDYYTYIYGQVSSTFTNTTYNKTAVQIIPEKIYYTKDKDLGDYLGLEKEYSTCAKPNNKCTDDEIKNGQLVNVSVNDSENIDFYVLKDDGESLTLLSQKILISEKAIDYYKEELALESFKPTDPASTDYILTSISSLKTLRDLTSNWTNIPYIKSFSESLDDSHLTITDGFTFISLNGNPETTMLDRTRTRLLNIEQDLSSLQDDNKIISVPCMLDFDLSKRAWGVDSCTIQTMDLYKNILIDKDHLSNEKLLTKVLSSKETEKWPNYTLSENVLPTSKYTHIVPVIEIPKTLIND